MFWNKEKEEKITGKGKVYLAPPPPPKKKFKTMYELLKDAEKYDNAGEEETSKKILENLKHYIYANCS